MGNFTDGYDEMPGWTRRRGQRGGVYIEEGNREGETGREGKEVVQAHEMPGWNEVTIFSDFAYLCNGEYPSQYTYKFCHYALSFN